MERRKWKDRPYKETFSLKGHSAVLTNAREKMQDMKGKICVTTILYHHWPT